jgi:hypothetical protein
MSSRFAALRSNWNWTWGLLGMFAGAATVISLVRNGLDIPLSGMPRIIYEHYIWLREALFWPIERLLVFVDLRLPGWSKDLIVGYLACGSAGVRVPIVPVRGLDGFKSSVGIPIAPYSANDRSIAFAVNLGRNKDSFFAMSIPVRLLFWPLSIFAFRRAVHRAQELEGDGLALHSLPYKQAFRYYILHCSMQLGLLSILCAGFFFWSYVSGRFGPPN